LVTGTDFVTQPVQDYEKASKFYGETLGLEFSKRWGDMPAGESEMGSLTIALMQPEAFGMKFRPSTSAIAIPVPQQRLLAEVNPEEPDPLAPRLETFTRSILRSRRSEFDDVSGIAEFVSV
jgi:catechol 2,3-dioxygenase-like lactoylglutathione lyase family enzyme